MAHAQTRLSRPLAAALLLAAQAAIAHVPFVESVDYTADAPFAVEDLSQSSALFSWLESGTDVDFFAMQIDRPTHIYVQTLVPRCLEYRNFGVSYALIGPGLPVPAQALPFEVPAGQGAVIVYDDGPDMGVRPAAWKLFGARHYFEGPQFELEASTPGDYRVAVWSESGSAGDYVAVIGNDHRSFSATDLWRAARFTATLRRGDELHGTCTQPDAGPARPPNAEPRFYRATTEGPERPQRLRSGAGGNFP